MQPIKKVNVSKLVQDQFLELIANKKLVPGDKLPSERAICEQLKVSRSSVREAIEGLCAFGIIAKKGNGVYVQDYKDKILKESMSVLVDLQNVTSNELIEARIATETQIVKLATEKATESDIEELRQMIKETENATSLSETRKLSAKFHKKLADMTNNPILINMFCTLYDLINRFERKNYETIKNHEDILEAIVKKDVELAEKTMILHLSNIKNSINE